MTAEIFEKIGSYHKSFDKSKISKVFNFVNEKYKDTDGNIGLNLAVLETLLPLKPDEDTITAILLHDLYVMSFVTDQSVKENFGQSVLGLLVALKKLYGLNYAENDKGIQMEVLRKMFLTLAKDIRVILIWLAYRLCILQNLNSYSSLLSNKIKLARETMNIYVPIASRLGIYRIKIQLEDLAFKYLYPQEYERLSKQINRLNRSKKLAIDLIQRQLKDFFESRGVKAEIQGRIKNVYSIYTKLSRKGLTHADELYDVFAIRIILPHHEKVDHLYGILGLIHSEWKPISSRFKDYIAVPKPNGYCSLHTVVLGLGPKDLDKPVEIQIRDERMHRESEYGVASHWLYKTRRSSSAGALNYHVDWIRGLEQIHEFFGAQSDMMKEVEIDVFKDRIFVLTPRGEVKDLPVGAIPIDFAYAVHTDVGNKCVSAKVNGSIVSLDYQLKNGDVVEIITRTDASPKLRWLSIVKSNFAKNKIRAWFSGLNRDKNIREGRMLINSQLERLNKPLLDQNYSILKNYVGSNLTLLQRESLLEEVGKGGKFASDIVRKIYPYEKVLPTKKIVSRAEPDLVSGKNMENLVLESQVIVGGETGLPVKFAACCLPKFGNRIIAYVTNRGKRITIHRYDCALLYSLNMERALFAEWKGMKSNIKDAFKVGIRLTVVSRVGLINDISLIISRMGINILDISIRKTGGGLYYDSFLLEMDDLNKFDELLDHLENVEGVIKAVRKDEFN